jgi:hypothetical protein
MIVGRIGMRELPTRWRDAAGARGTVDAIR